MQLLLLLLFLLLLLLVLRNIIYDVPKFDPKARKASARANKLPKEHKTADRTLSSGRAEETRTAEPAESLSLGLSIYSTACLRYFQVEVGVLLVGFALHCAIFNRFKSDTNLALLKLL